MASNPNTSVEFGLFDREADTALSHRFLPHWFQPNVATFITFRTTDSLPRSALELWHREQVDWLRRLGLDEGAASDPARLTKLPPQKQLEFRQLRDRAWHHHLDRGHGACPLANPVLAKVVAEALTHFDGDRYDLDSFIVMPNHVHVLVQFRPTTSMRKQMTSWLRYSATQINRAVGTHGSFWQSEPFDHLVRSVDQFAYLQRYIANNGKRANLPASNYLYWSRLPNVPRHSVP